MDETPRKDIRVGRVWDLSDPPAATFMQFFEEEFARGNIAASGLRSCLKDGEKIERRKLIDAPLDYSIDWLGTKPRSGAGDYAVAARRREVPRMVDDYLGVQRTSSTDIFEDLTVTETDWDRVCGAVAEWIREWINMVYGDRIDASADLARIAASPLNLEGVSDAPSDPQVETGTDFRQDRTPARVPRRHGPEPGASSRYGESDRALYPEIERLMKPTVLGERSMTLTAATLKLAHEGKISGKNSKPESLAKRLRERYKADHPKVG